MMKSGMMPGHALIIGSGIGGLTAGIILSKLHIPVTVVEKNALPGGLMRSYRKSGIDCPVGVHYMGALDAGQPLRRIWDDLGVTSAIPLDRMGTEGIVDRYVFDDFIFDLPTGLDAFEESLNRTFPDEPRQISMIMADLRKMSSLLNSLDMVLSPDMAFLLPESLEPMGERLHLMACSRRLTSVLAVPSTLIGVPLHDCPVFYYYMTLASYLMSSWRLACSGAHMAEAFVSRLQALGGRLVTGDGVVSIKVDSGQVEGVLLDSGTFIPADTVIAALHPKKLLSLLPLAEVRPSYSQRVSQLTDTKGIFGIHLALNAEVNKPLPYNIYRLRPEPDGSLIRGVFYQLRQSGRPDTNLLSIITASGIEEWRLWEHTQTGHRGGDYQAAKEQKAIPFIQEASELFGPLSEMKIIDIYTPLSLRDWVGSPDGSPYGILRSAGQLMKTASLNRPSVKGLYPAGQNRLCPGIMGTMLGSFQAVRQIIGREAFDMDVLGGLI
ncbi:MAG: hypothetical protein CSYNP_00398 [Syntrophus sp. SKADARSKE-3]|nr:hypothetical protein [Syntrophus sp. SKADARSKE-3]